MDKIGIIKGLVIGIWITINIARIENSINYQTSSDLEYSVGYLITWLIITGGGVFGIHWVFTKIRKRQKAKIQKTQ